MQGNAVKIINILRQSFGEHPRCELHYGSDWELLTAIILSAQCTDRRVNAVTPKLFLRFKTVKEMADADITEIENIIKPCGFYRSKANHIKQTAVRIMECFGGTVPKTITELMTLSGVGEKTASVFVAEFYNIPAIGVDTHIKRVSKRLDLSNSKTPPQISRDLQKQLPSEEWRDFHTLLVLFGRYVCTARKPKCEECPLCKLCSNSRII
jgi:endonuclease-3